MLPVGGQGKEGHFLSKLQILSETWETLSHLLQVGRVHLSDEGLRHAKQFLQQALSDSNLNQGGVWKRRPAGRQVPGLRTPKVHGNLIVF